MENTRKVEPKPAGHHASAQEPLYPMQSVCSPESLWAPRVQCEGEESTGLWKHLLVEKVASQGEMEHKVRYSVWFLIIKSIKLQEIRPCDTHTPSLPPHP